MGYQVMVRRKALISALFAVALLPSITSPVRADAAAPFAQALAEARADAVAERPQDALAAFRAALAAAGGDAESERTARFGIARMLMWLGRYEEARSVYATLLTCDLSPEDRQIALAGEVKSLAYLDRPREAFRTVGDAPVVSSDLTVAAAQAASWSGWSDKAQALLERGEPALAQLAPGSQLAHQARSLADDVHRDLAPTVTVNDAYAHDSDGLSTNDTTASVRAPVSRTAAVDVRVRAFDLHDAAWSLHGTETRAGFDARAGDATTVSVTAGRGAYAGWTPAVWSSDVAYQATDDLRVAAYASGEAVETQTAIANRTTARTLGARATLRLADPLALSAGTYVERFSDGNVRHGVDASLAVAAVPSAGIGLLIRERAFSDATAGLGYFSPAHYVEQNYAVTVRRRVRRWFVDASAGLGHQAGGGSAGTPFSYALTVRGPVGGCLRADASLNAQNSALSSASGYRRTGAAIGFSCAL
ncbi:hypothetical protein WPS_20660 [Vulcanimicrobium alpinum]|uniref:Tetratricopeptide repeat protein n=1 Tax=Vulcanimicrobium alpinum TaxID=3016050 RepID=A0AAN1XXL7_UNVUL|nr:hypothetical protein [Vulcanimicrobium alpinum]BDE06790.1 hypothetical protein WPS_20660 [Vulcanimicrobium alpinum]